MTVNTPVYRSLTSNLEELASLLGHPFDLATERHGEGRTLGLAYIESLVGVENLKSNLLKPILQEWSDGIPSLDRLAVLLPECDPRLLSDLPTVAADLLAGRAVIFRDHEPAALSFRAQRFAGSVPREPGNEQVIRGPREAFTGDITGDMGMIRRWIEDDRLRADQLRIGRHTKTRVGLVFLSSVAQPSLVKEVKRRLAAIDIDGVVESGYLEQLIKDRRATVFPLTQATERPDKVVAGILEGRVAILTDRSPAAILVPATINELYQSSEDYYVNFWLGSFMHLLRLFGSIFAVGLPGLYVAFASFNPELLPTGFALGITISRSRAPMPLAIEIILIEIALGIFFEAALRMPKAIGPTIGIVSGIVMLLALVLSGLISPITVVVVAFTAVASYTSPDYVAGLTWRVLKYIMLFSAVFFGFFGLTVAGVLILGHAADLKSFGTSYLAPWAPLQWPELADAATRAPFWSRWRRPATYRPRDKRRSGGTKQEEPGDE